MDTGKNNRGQVWLVNLHQGQLLCPLGSALTTEQLHTLLICFLQ